MTISEIVTFNWLFRRLDVIMLFDLIWTTFYPKISKTLTCTVCLYYFLRSMIFNCIVMFSWPWNILECDVWKLKNMYFWTICHMKEPKYCLHIANKCDILYSVKITFQIKLSLLHYFADWLSQCLWLMVPLCA